MNTKFGITQQAWLMFKCVPILGILPYYSQTYNKLLSAKWYRYTLVLLFTAAALFELYHRFQLKGVDLRHLDIVLITVLMVLSIASSGKHTNQFYRYFDEFDWLLCHKHDLTNSTVKFINWKFTGLQLFAILSSAMDLLLYIYVWHGWVSTIFYTVTTFYIGNIYIVQIVLMDFILNKFEVLRLAMDVFQSHHASVAKMKSMCELHWILCELVHEFNNIFGWQLLLQTIMTCFAIMVALECMLFLDFDAIIFICVLYNVFYLTVLYIYLVAQSSKLGKMFDILSRKAGRLLYKESKSVRLSESLKAFSEQANKRACVTAASFFAFDYTLIMPLFALLSTFLILIVQAKMD